MLVTRQSLDSKPSWAKMESALIEAKLIEVQKWGSFKTIHCIHASWTVTQPTVHPIQDSIVPARHQTYYKATLQGQHPQQFWMYPVIKMNFLIWNSLQIGSFTLGSLTIIPKHSVYLLSFSKVFPPLIDAAKAVAKGPNHQKCTAVICSRGPYPSTDGT